MRAIGLQPYQYGIEPPPVLEAEGRLSTNPMMGSSTVSSISNVTF